MKLLIQPEDGAAPLIEAIQSAKKSIEIAIFRCDHPDIERALVDAIKAGVAVQALIAFTNRGGEKTLRGLEARLLAAGAVVARTNNDLARYHGKYLIIDRKRLLLLGFNFTTADLRRTRSFGVISSNPKLVQAVEALFQTDCSRQEFSAKCRDLVVSPANARERLADFISGAKKRLLIYDPKISDTTMLKLLKEQHRDGVEVRVIGQVKDAEHLLEVRACHPLRLHTRTIVRDGNAVFIGSQSLSRLELDMRREVGVMLRDSTIADAIQKIFETDWESSKTDQMPAEKVARKVAKAVAKGMGPIGPVLNEIAAKNGTSIEESQDIEGVVRDAVKAAVQDAVHQMVTESELVKQ